MSQLGPVGKLGRWTATHFRAVAAVWLLIAVAFGVFAPRVETALSGAGWGASGSQSVQARNLIAKNFKGLGSYGLMVVIHAPTERVRDPQFQQTVSAVEGKLRANTAVTTVVSPKSGISISRDGHTAVVQAGAAKNPNEMVRAADEPLAALGVRGVQVNPTGAPRMWSDFNAANRAAMLKSEVISCRSRSASSFWRSARLSPRVCC